MSSPAMTPASNLADFQRSFGAHLRAPRQSPRPAGTPARRMAVYVELVHNNLAGFREGSDYLPKRFTHEASTMPGSEGHVCELDLMLEEYYEDRGWVNGVVPEAKLKELEII